MRRTVLIAGLSGLILGVALPLIGSRGGDLVAIRDRPPTLVAGELGGGRILSQHVQRVNGAVARVEIALRAPAEVGTNLGTLRARRGDGGWATASGRVVAGPHRGTPYLRFDFDDLEVGHGGGLQLELGGDGAAFTPHLRTSGMVGTRWDFVRAPLPAGEHWRAIRCDYDRWSGLALPIAASATGSGPLVLEIYALPIAPSGLTDHRQPNLAELDAPAHPSEPPLRRVVLPTVPALRAGHLPLRFEPIEGSRQRLFALRLTTPDGVQTVGGEDGSGFGFVTLHGDHPGGDLGSTAIDGIELPGTDLQLWVWYDGYK